MKYSTENFDLRLVSPVKDISFPADYKKGNIVVDLGDVKKGGLADIIFMLTLKNGLKTKYIDGSCSCMNASQIYDTTDPKEKKVVFSYKSSRIGKADPYGPFKKFGIVALSDGTKINVKIKMNGIK